MKRTLLILMILLSYNSVKCQNYSSIISDSEIYNFLNWLTDSEYNSKKNNLFSRKKISNKILNWNKENFISNDSILNDIEFNIDNEFLFKKGTDLVEVFNKKDIEYMLKQFNSIKDSIWHNNFTGSTLILEKSNKINTEIHYYSVPLFSQDKKIVLIYKIYYCGDECEYGGYYVYRRIDNKKWKLIKSVRTWIS